ncbi:hypothetical protein HK098_005560 [Nowakowskiella sp. JEL0407]|nr:hypothetical protein HK098_005560 [Nowakowskiella sp. JEL0407]
MSDRKTGTTTNSLQNASTSPTVSAKITNDNPENSTILIAGVAIAITGLIIGIVLVFIWTRFRRKSLAHEDDKISIDIPNRNSTIQSSWPVRGKKSTSEKGRSQTPPPPHEVVEGYFTRDERFPVPQVPAYTVSRKQSLRTQAGMDISQPSPISISGSVSGSFSNKTALTDLTGISRFEPPRFTSTYPNPNTSLPSPLNPASYSMQQPIHPISPIENNYKINHTPIPNPHPKEQFTIQNPSMLSQQNDDAEIDDTDTDSRGFSYVYGSVFGQSVFSSSMNENPDRNSYGITSEPYQTQQPTFDLPSIPNSQVPTQSSNVNTWDRISKVDTDTMDLLPSFKDKFLSMQVNNSQSSVGNNVSQPDFERFLHQLNNRETSSRSSVREARLRSGSQFESDWDGSQFGEPATSDRL